MGFFTRTDDGDEEHRATLERIEQGGIPASAEARLQALGAGGSMFTSGLSVNEFALLHRLGPQPLAQVMGASVIRVGWQYLPSLDPGLTYFSASPLVPGPVGYQIDNRYTEPSIAQVRNYKWRTEVVCKLDVLTNAWNTARRRALDRLLEEANQVGADAVVGVHLHRSDHDLGKGLIEYVVTGTAIRVPGSTGKEAPLLTDVSVQDYWKLHNGGHQPVGFVAATAVVFASPSRVTRLRRLRTAASNQELSELSRGFHDARESVRSALRDQVSYAKGTGAVGVEFSHSVQREEFGVASSVQTPEMRGWHRGPLGLPYRVSGRGDAERPGWVITMHAAGTAIRHAPGPPPPVKTSMRVGGR